MKKIALILTLILVASLSCGVSTAFATEAVYSSVLDDLHKDSAFDVSNYPSQDDEYSLQVIQLAESADGELFIYVYMPCGNAKSLKASSITLSTSKNNNAAVNFANYQLTFLNGAGVFHKYKLTNFNLLTDNVRYYNVASISRPWDKYIDKPSGDNVISEKSFAVGKLWTATTTENGVSYTMEETEVIEITDKFVGYVNYSDGYKLSFGDLTVGATSAHFVAFSTNKLIDQLIEAEVEFKTQNVKYKYCVNFLHSHCGQRYDFNYGAVEKHEPVVLHDSDYAGTNVGVDFSDKHEWKRIMTSSEFLNYHNNEDYQIITKDNADIANKQWVLSFYETPILSKSDLGWETVSFPLSTLWKGETEAQYTEVYDVMILRLMFQTNGKVYNLGVVDNKQTGNGSSSNTPVNKVKAFFEKAKQWLTEYWWVIVVGIVFVILIVCLAVDVLRKGLWIVVKAIGKGLYYFFKYLFIGLYYVIASPVYLIALIVRKIKERR